MASTDQQVRQLYAIVKEEVRSLAARHDWQILRKEWLFLSNALPDQLLAIPPDFDHFVSNTFFNRSTMREVIGPITPQQWQAIRAQPQLNRVFLAFIQRGGEFLVSPTPPSGETVAYEYITNLRCYSALDVPKVNYEADSDTCFMDEELVKLGLRWRFLKSKGLEYAEDFRTYETECNQSAARDGGSGELNTTGDGQYVLSPNLPSGNFPFL